MLNTPFNPWPSFTEAEIDAVSDTLRSNKVSYWTGEKCKAFEIAFSKLVGVEHGIALANGTLALDVAIKALNLPAKSEVVVTPRSYIASVSSVVLAGLTPVFADVDANTQNLSAETIEAVLTEKTKAIVLVHLAGMPADMDSIMELASNRGLKIIEDCAQAHGAMYKGSSVGSFGDIATWSFCQDKIMTTGGEGGMVTTNNKDLWSKMWSFKDHGKDYDAVFNRQHPDGFRWLHESFGSNFRMLEMQAAVGLIQLDYLQDWSRKRLKNANAIWNVAQTCSALRVPPVDTHVTHAAYRAYVFVRPSRLKEGWSRDRIMDSISKQGVPVFTGSAAEIYREKAFEATSFRPKNRLSVAKELGETSLAFLVHPTLTDLEIEKTCETLKSVLEQAQS